MPRGIIIEPPVTLSNTVETVAHGSSAPTTGRLRGRPAMITFGILPGGGCVPSSLAFSFHKEGKNDHSRRPASLHNQVEVKTKKRCLRCDTLYDSRNNFPTACSFHGHTTGEKGLFSLAPPHQGIDGEWSDQSGVIVYRWNDKGNRPNTGRVNWKRRWSCCAEYGKDAPPCRRGWHVSYDDGFTLY